MSGSQSRYGIQEVLPASYVCAVPMTPDRLRRDVGKVVSAIPLRWNLGSEPSIG